MNDQQHDRRASAAYGGRLPFGGKMNDEDEITDLRRKTVHGNGAAPYWLIVPESGQKPISLRALGYHVSDHDFLEKRPRHG
jgi:hypothetical protein